MNYHLKSLPIERLSHRLPNLRANDAGLSLLLFTQCFATFVAVPLVATQAVGPWLLDLCLLFSAVICAVAFTDRRSMQAALLCFLLGIVLGPPFWTKLTASIAMGAVNPHETISVAAFGFNLLITLLVARQVFGGGHVTRHRILGAVLVYLNVAVMFSIAYDFLDMFLGGAIKATTPGGATHGIGVRIAVFSYFSFSTITTGGYGDFIPVHPIARSLANLEAVFGQLFPATFVARLVALHLVHSEAEKRPPG